MSDNAMFTNKLLSPAQIEKLLPKDKRAVLDLEGVVEIRREVLDVHAEETAGDLAVLALQPLAERDDGGDDRVRALAGGRRDLVAGHDAAVGADQPGEDLGPPDIDREHQLAHLSAPVAMPPMK